MTDGWLMDADCIHGAVWYECKECGSGPEPDPGATLLSPPNDTCEG